MSSAPDAWAIHAAELPLAFAQVREDPRLDLELARALPPGSTVVMIASGGETAACLGRLPLRFHLVDMNPAQLALSRMKWHLAGKADATGAMKFLGHLHAPPEERRQSLVELTALMELPLNIFGPVEDVCQSGPDHIGRYEITFAELRKCLAPWRAELDRCLNSVEPIRDLDATGLGAALDAAFSQVMRLENLVCLFGNEATQNPRMPFSDHFADRTRDAFRNLSPRTNPFLWQILAGEFHPQHPYDWLLQGSMDGPPMTEAVEWHCGKMADVLDTMPAGSAGLVHLSNILDWLSSDEARETLQKARRVLAPGGRIVIRQLNSTLEIPALESGFIWDNALGGRLERQDRSYFYPGIIIGSHA